jgi:hypothetical protein
VHDGRARMSVSLVMAVLVVKLSIRFGHVTYCVQAAVKLMGNFLMTMALECMIGECMKRALRNKFIYMYISTEWSV